MTVEDVRREVEAELRRWHRDNFGGSEHPQPHGSFSDSLAFTHCICYGSMYRTLAFLHSRPDLLDQLKDAE